MGGGLVQIHNVVGTLVVVAFLILTILNALRAAGREIPVARTVSMGAAGLLLVQYVIGVLLLGQGSPLNGVHVVVALAALVTVGLEHGYAATRDTTRQRAIAALIATLGTTILVGAAHGIGSASDSTVEAALLSALLLFG
jgi:heme A synthase